ncbi:MAG: 50S ribosomal protein L9 [bacterium]
MRVILRREIENLGDVGDVIEVADGYGMNHLIPKGLALQASAGSVRAAQHEQMLRESQIQAAKRGSENEAGKINGTELEFTARAGEDGRLFGSVTNRDIETALAEKGLKVSRRKILLEEPIRRVGEHDVEIRLHPEVKAQIKVHVLADRTDPPAEAAAAEEKKEDENSQEETAEAAQAADIETPEEATEEKPSSAE